MTRRRGRAQSFTVNESNNTRKLVNFNYSENINRITNFITENYRRWKGNMIHILNFNGLLTYVTTDKRDVKNNLENYIDKASHESQKTQP